ncbi:MAG: CPBP family intramembrane glutamic endopeptidase [Pseudomonadota bacterium]
MSITAKSIIFLVLTFTLSWGVTLVGVAVGANTTPTGAFFALFAMMFGPSIAALICAMSFERGHVREALGLKWTPNWFWLLAWLGAFALGAVAIGLTVALDHGQFADPAQNLAMQVAAHASPAAVAKFRAIPPNVLDVILIAQVIGLGSLINIPALVFTEELGWRGYLYTLWRPSGFWRSALATGAIWGVWHAPAIYFYGHNYPDNRLIGVPMFVLFCTLLAPIMTYVRDRGRSVIAPAILHGMINATAGFAALCLSGATFPWNGVVGIGGLIALALGVFVVGVVQPRRKASA